MAIFPSPAHSSISSNFSFSTHDEEVLPRPSLPPSPPQSPTRPVAPAREIHLNSSGPYAPTLDRPLGPRDIVWAAVPTWPYWPGVIVDPVDYTYDPSPEVVALASSGIRRQKSGHHVLVFFFFENTIAWVPKSRVKDFNSEENFLKFGPQDDGSRSYRASLKFHLSVNIAEQELKQRWNARKQLPVVLDRALHDD